MISVRLNATIPEETINPEECYKIGTRLIAELTKINPALAHWWDLPNSPKDHYAAYADKDKIIQRVERKIK